MVAATSSFNIQPAYASTSALPLKIPICKSIVTALATQIFKINSEIIPYVSIFYLKLS